MGPRSRTASHVAPYPGRALRQGKGPVRVTIISRGFKSPRGRHAGHKHELFATVMLQTRHLQAAYAYPPRSPPRPHHYPQPHPFFGVHPVQHIIVSDGIKDDKMRTFCKRDNERFKVALMCCMLHCCHLPLWNWRGRRILEPVRYSKT